MTTEETKEEPKEEVLEEKPKPKKSRSRSKAKPSSMSLADLKDSFADLLTTVNSKTTELAVSAVDDKADGWLDRTISEGRKLAADKTTGALEEEATKALDKLEANKEPFKRLGKYSLGVVVAHWGNDAQADARRRYLSTKATFEERRIAMQMAGDAAYNEEKEREESWEAVKDVFVDIGMMGLKFLAKTLIAGLAI